MLSYEKAKRAFDDAVMAFDSYLAGTPMAFLISNERGAKMARKRFAMLTNEMAKAANELDKARVTINVR